MDTSQEKEPISVLSVIQKIKNGELNPRILPKDIRLLCIEALLFEGYNKTQIAEILKYSTKNIKRDIDEIYEENASLIDKDSVKRYLGRLEMMATTHHSHLMRLARDKSASIMERSQSEFLAFKVLMDITKFYQTIGRLGYKEPIEVERAGKSEDKVDQSTAIRPNLPQTPEERERVMRSINLILRHRLLPIEDILPNYTIAPKDPACPDKLAVFLREGSLKPSIDIRSCF